MSGLFIRAWFERADEAVALLETTLERQVRDVLLAIAQTVAAKARANHPWQNRTGELERHTVAAQNVREYANGNLVAEVQGAMPYGSYLENSESVDEISGGGGTFDAGTTTQGKWAWLEPAWRSTEAQNISALDEAVQRACTNAGW